MWLCFSLAAYRNSSLTFAILVMVCLHLWLFEFILFGTLCAFRFSKFSAGVSSNIFWSPPLLSFPFGFPVMCMSHKSHMFLFIICLSVSFFCLITAFKILVSQSDIEPRPPALQVQSLNYGTVREFLCLMFWLDDLHNFIFLDPLCIILCHLVSYSWLLEYFLS